MPQSQVAVNHELGEQTTKPPLRPQSLETVRYWEWDCSVKSQSFSVFQQNSSQSDKFRQILCNSYALTQPVANQNQSRQYPILVMDPTEFIIIQHNPTHFHT